MKKVLFTLILACMTAFVFSESPPEKVPRPECSVDQVIDVAPSYQMVQLATVDFYLFVVETSSYTVCKVQPVAFPSPDDGLRSLIQDFGNNRYRRVQIKYLSNLEPDVLLKAYFDIEKPPLVNCGTGFFNILNC